LLMQPQTPRSTLFPYTTLFRSICSGTLTTNGGNNQPFSCPSGPVVIGNNQRIRLRLDFAGGDLITLFFDGDSPAADSSVTVPIRSEEHTSELQSRFDLVCRLLL